MYCVRYILYQSVLFVQRGSILADSCGKQHTLSLRLVKKIRFFKVTQR